MLLHLPQTARSMTLVVLTVLAMLAVLRWASGFFIPLMLGFEGPVRQLAAALY